MASGIQNERSGRWNTLPVPSYVPGEKGPELKN